MPVNFDDAIPFFGNSVAAMGPEDPNQKIVEICVWVYQLLPDGTSDVAATEMTTHEDPEHPGHKHFLRVDGAGADKPGRWLLPLKKVGSDLPFRDGLAIAIAIALVKEGEKQRVVWWFEQVQLQADQARVDKANEAVDPRHELQPGQEPEDVLRAGGALAEPLKFKGTD